LIWFTFISSIGITSYFFSQHFAEDRLKSIDSQIEINANLIIDSPLVVSNPKDLNEAEEIIYEAMGGYRMGILIILKDLQDKLIYRNKNAENLEIDLHETTPWQFIEKEDNSIRVVCKVLKKKKRVLYFGMVVPQASLTNPFFDFITGWFGWVLFIASGAVSFLVSMILLAPLKRLSLYLNELTLHVEPKYLSQALLPQTYLPKSLEKARYGLFGQFDEFNHLLQSLREFLIQVTNSLKINVAHSARLAHELNTPLTIIKNEVTLLGREVPEKSKKKIELVNSEINRLGSFVHDYLTWAESLSSLKPDEVFAIKLENFVEDLKSRLESISSGRLNVVTMEKGVVVANSVDLEHVLLNLVQNALKYSPEQSPVELKIYENRIELSDQGPGIPPEVLNRLGEPFNLGEDNRGAQKKGSGLGLALVMLICKKYGWLFKFEKKMDGASIAVVFGG
jgi:signal transduction histidine kinase